MSFTMHPALEAQLNSCAALAGFKTVQAILNRAGAAKPEKGKVIPFKREPDLWWVDRD